MKRFFNEEPILDSAAQGEPGNRKIGFQHQSEEPVKDALADDQQMAEILAANSAIALLAIKKKIANIPMTEVDRRIYYEAIGAKCSTEFGYWDVDYAARKEEEARKASGQVGFQLEGAKVTVTTDAAEPKFTVIKDEGIDGETMDVCLCNPVAITDAGGKPTGWYKQVVSRVDAINGNNRLYPRPVYGPALDALKQAGFPYAGEHPHPKSYKGADGRVLFNSSVPNQAVRFRNAEIDPSGNVWAEYMPLQTDMGKQVQAMLDAGLPIGFSNRMTGSMAPAKVNGKPVNVARNLKLYTWDVVLNPAEAEAFSAPEQLTDAAITEILDSIKEDDKQMNFLSMSLAELKAWKAANSSHKDMAICDEAIRLKELAEQSPAITDELEKLRKEKADREAKEAADQKKAEAKTALTDAVTALPYDQKTKDALLKKGEAITDAADIPAFIEREKAFVDSISVGAKLASLGVPVAGKAAVIDPDIQIGASPQPWRPIIDNLMAAFDDNIRSRTGFIPDPELRKANKAILDRIMAKMERDNHPEYDKNIKVLTDSAQNIQDGVITDSAVSTTGDFAQSAIISQAILEQVWQDLLFLQLVMAEPFSGTTYKILSEITSMDLLSQDDLIVGETDGIPTEGVATTVLEFGAEWMKRGTVVTKEAMRELMSGPFNYDALGRNLANLNMRFARYIDQRLSLEMLHVSDEYQAVPKANEAVAAAEMTAAAPGTNVPAGSNAAWIVKLLCGYATGAIGAQVPPVVRPRVRQYIDPAGQKQTTVANQVTAKKGANTLVRGTWDPVTGKISDGADYAVDFENAKAYFTAASGVDNSTNKPTVSYSYATNVSFFDLTVPNGVEAAKYFNRLLERFDYEKAYMGSAPRYSVPNFAIGSLNAMVNLKIAELFYKWASPDGTNLLSGRMYFATRNGLQLGEINAPWTAGDKRLLLGKINASRFGVGSPMQMEGPEPYYAPDGKITSAKQYYATQQISIATPLVTDKNGVTYNPPYRTLKFYNS